MTCGLLDSFDIRTKPMTPDLSFRILKEADWGIIFSPAYGSLRKRAHGFPIVARRILEQ
jgi:hypothetical protein